MASLDLLSLVTQGQITDDSERTVAIETIEVEVIPLEVITVEISEEM